MHEVFEVLDEIFIGRIEQDAGPLVFVMTVGVSDVSEMYSYAQQTTAQHECDRNPNFYLLNWEIRSIV